MLEKLEYEARDITRRLVWEYVKNTRKQFAYVYEKVDALMQFWGIQPDCILYNVIQLRATREVLNELEGDAHSTPTKL